MRNGRVLIALLLFQSTGCSFLIMNCGKDVSTLEDQTAVRNRLGLPDSTSESGEVTVESYHTRWKIAEPLRSGMLGEYWLFSFGLLEFVEFPNELYRLGRGSVLGRELSFYYDRSGKVVGISLDDDSWAVRPPHFQIEDVKQSQVEEKD